MVFTDVSFYTLKETLGNTSRSGCSKTRTKLRNAIKLGTSMTKPLGSLGHTLLKVTGTIVLLLLTAGVPMCKFPFVATTPSRI